MRIIERTYQPQFMVLYGRDGNVHRINFQDQRRSLAIHQSKGRQRGWQDHAGFISNIAEGFFILFKDFARGHRGGYPNSSIGADYIIGKHCLVHVKRQRLFEAKTNDRLNFLALGWQGLKIQQNHANRHVRQYHDHVFRFPSYRAQGSTQCRTERLGVKNVREAQSGSNRTFLPLPGGEDLQPRRLVRSARCDHPFRGDLTSQPWPYRLLVQTCHFYLVVSMKVTLLISFIVVTPALTRASAESRRNFIPSSCAALRISDDGRFSRISSRMRSDRSSSSWIAVRP